MDIPASPEARLYYRSAFPRYEDAQILLRADRTTGAVYLAGYGIECILKALVLSILTPAGRAFTLVNDWSTDLRYLPRTMRADEARDFLAAAESILRWVDGRL